MIHVFTSLLCMIIFISGLSGCAINDRTKPIQNIFLEDVDVTRQVERVPFNHAALWHKPQPDAYKKIYLKPVRLDLLPEDTWEESKSIALTSREAFQESAREIADYFHEQLQGRLKEVQSQGLKVVSAPGARTLAIEIALTEMEFSRPVSRAGTFLIPLPFVDMAFSTITDPHAAFAMRITDSQSGQLIATIADRKFPPTRVVDVHKLSLTSSVREICDNWSVELAQALSTGSHEKVEERGTFRLLPW